MSNKTTWSNNFGVLLMMFIHIHFYIEHNHQIEQINMDTKLLIHSPITQDELESIPTSVHNEIQSQSIHTFRRCCLKQVPLPTNTTTLKAIGLNDSNIPEHQPLCLIPNLSAKYLASQTFTITKLGIHPPFSGDQPNFPNLTQDSETDADAMIANLTEKIQQLETECVGQKNFCQTPKQAILCAKPSCVNHSKLKPIFNPKPKQPNWTMVLPL